MYKKIILSLFFIFGVNSRFVLAQGSLQDSLALVEMYDSTDGDNCTNNTNWKTSPLSALYVITVEKGQIIETELYNNNLARSITSLIGDFDSLKIL